MNDPVTASEQAWSQLRIVAGRIQRRDLARGLSQLNEAATLAGAVGDPGLAALVRLLSADAEYKSGRFDQAASIYGLVRTAGTEQEQGHLFFRASLGEILCLLKLSRVDEATAIGHALLEAAAIPPPGIPDPAPAGVALPVPSLMPPVAAITRRLGTAFLREGFVTEAKAYLALAQSDPDSTDALTAAEHDAALLLQQGDPTASEQKLLPLRGSGETRRTLSARGWRILLTARFQKQVPLFTEADAHFLTRIPANRNRAKVQLTILSRLRECGDASWKTWLSKWNLTGPRAHPATRLAASKLLLADCRVQTNEPTARAALAGTVASNPKASPADVIAAGRDALLAAAAAGNSFDESGILASAEERFGELIRLRVLHTLCKAAVEAKDTPLALRLLNRIREEASPGSKRRLKATQTLAELHFGLRHYSESSLLSRELAGSPLLAPMFRLQALNRLCASLRLQGGRENEHQAALAMVPEIIPPEADAVTLLTMARLVRLSEFRNPPLLASLLTRAVAAAQAEQAAAEHPSPAIQILLVMARKLFWDFQNPAAIAAHWISLGAERRDWLWSPSASWWEYVSLVMRSFAAIGDHGNSRNLLGMAMKDAPVEGRVWVRSAAADLLRESGDMTGALRVYSQSAEEDPSHPENARAFYWLGLQAHAVGDAVTAVDLLHGVRRCLGTGISLLWHWEIDARARILLQPSATAGALARGTKYSHTFLEEQRPLLAADLALLPAN